MRHVYMHRWWGQVPSELKNGRCGRQKLSYTSLRGVLTTKAAFSAEAYTRSFSVRARNGSAGLPILDFAQDGALNQ